MNYKFWILTLFTALVFSGGCSQNNTQSTNQKVDVSVIKGKVLKQYTCPMDTDVVSNKPGVCPKCGMDLVEKDQD